MYSISDFATRPTVDSDYLLKDHSNESISVENLVCSILDVPTVHKSLRIELREVIRINEVSQYPGVRVNLLGYMGTTITPFSIDFGVGDKIIPEPILRTLPVILDEFSKPTILTYSFESIISEKLDAIIRFMEATGRMKDFYDIYYLASSFEFDGRNLQSAIYETFLNRRTIYEEHFIWI